MPALVLHSEGCAILVETGLSCIFLQFAAVMQVFKWERRKGWDILLKAFLTEFTSKNNVALYLKTCPFHSHSNFAEQMQQWVEDHMLESETSLDKLPAVYVIDEHMTQDRLRSLYAAVDCFVLPSRCDRSRSSFLDSID